MDYLWVGLGGFAGANARYILSDAIRLRLGLDFPSGTLIINLTGSLLIGILLTLLTERLIVDPLWRRLLVVGFLGGYTTFSSYIFEALGLLEQGRWASAALYIVGSNGVGLLACGVGIMLARRFGA